MTITPERLQEGLSYDAFKDVLTRSKQAFEASERGVSLTGVDLEPFAALASPMNVLVIVTETCPDVIMNVPILQEVSRRTGKLALRIFLRDDHKDLMARYMNGPYESVPVFVFLDESWRERAVWIERPKAVTELRARLTREIYTDNPLFGSPDSPPSDLPENVRAQLQAAIRKMREDSGKDYARETIRDLGDLMVRIGQQSANASPIWRGNLAAVAV